MTISLIMAAARDGLIGDRGKLPWHLPRDLKRFRAITWGKPIIMGRRTFDSLGRALPGRCNIVLTHQADFRPPDAEVVSSLPAAIELATHRLPQDSEPEIMVIGGAQVFREALPLADRAYLTIVEGTFEGDVRFPLEVFEQERWRRLDEEVWPPDEKNPHPALFRRYDRQRRD